MTINNKVIVILGPTASGKTGLSIELAKRLNTEIISADSMQIFKFLNIGTAKPSVNEMEGIKHHLIDIIEPNTFFNVSMYKKMAEEKIDEILLKNKIPIIVGGTGLYLNSLIYNIQFEETRTDYDYRYRLEEVARTKGNDFLFKQLEEVDKEAAAKIHPNNLKRVIRALEVYHISGEKITEMQKRSIVNKSKYDFFLFGIDINREVLYERINSRVDEMIENKLIEEVKSLKEKGYLKVGTSIQAIGYKEILQYFDGSTTLPEAIEHIKRESRRYAKRQMTWFRKIDNINWLNQDKYKNIENILKKIKLNIEK